MSRLDVISLEKFILLLYSLVDFNVFFFNKLSLLFNNKYLFEWIVQKSKLLLQIVMKKVYDMFDLLDLKQQRRNVNGAKAENRIMISQFLIRSIIRFSI